MRSIFLPLDIQVSKRCCIPHPHLRRQNCLQSRNPRRPSKRRRCRRPPSPSASLAGGELAPAAKRRHRRARHVSAGTKPEQKTRVPSGTAPGCDKPACPPSRTGETPVAPSYNSSRAPQKLLTNDQGPVELSSPYGCPMFQDTRVPFPFRSKARKKSN